MNYQPYRQSYNELVPEASTRDLWRGKMDANIALPAALIGDPTRAAILLALFDGRAQPASALAYAAHVSAQAASNHLAKLSDGGLLAVEAQGRHRYYRL